MSKNRTHGSIVTYHKWNLDLVIVWKIVSALVFNITKDTYIRWFQFRIIHRILRTKSRMFKTENVANNLCTLFKMK